MTTRTPATRAKAPPAKPPAPTPRKPTEKAKRTRKEQAPSPLLLNVNAAAALLGLPRSRVYPLIMAGQLASLKIGGRRYVSVYAIEAFVRGEQQTA